MDISTIIEIAEDKIVADLCVRWWLLNCKSFLTDEEQIEKHKIYFEIQDCYKKINKSNI